jgi:hypothetical protein
VEESVEGGAGLTFTFERDGTQLATPLNMLWAMQRDKVCESVNCSQALVAGSDAAISLLLQVTQKKPCEIRRYVHNQELVHGFVRLLSDEGQQQAQCVAITALSVARQITFGDQMFE